MVVDVVDVVDVVVLVVELGGAVVVGRALVVGRDVVDVEVVGTAVLDVAGTVVDVVGDSPPLLVMA